MFVCLLSSYATTQPTTGGEGGGGGKLRVDRRISLYQRNLQNQLV